MSDALVISNLILWVLVLALAGVVAALVRQIGVLHERVAPAGALAVQGGPAPGEPAPELEVRDWNGQPLRLGGSAEDGRSTLLVFLSPTCQVCRSLLPALSSARGAEREWLRVVVASDGPRAEHAAFVAEHALDRAAYVLSAELGLAWRVAQLPYAALVDEAGVVLAAGLVNTREHLESLFEARERGVATLQEYSKEAKGSRRVA
jgi:methylamine dehydrogenase accessory protein MauD